MIGKPTVKIGKVTPKALPPAKAPAPVQAKPVPAGPKSLPPARNELSEEEQVLADAKAAVAAYETERRILNEMREEWSARFPEADVSLREVKEQEDRTVDSIQQAKPLLQQAKTPIGDFKVQRKFRDPHYDDKELTKLIFQGSNTDILTEMETAGLIKFVNFDADATLAWVAQRPAYSEMFKSAFREKEELTAAVTVPKL